MYVSEKFITILEIAAKKTAASWLLNQGKKEAKKMSKGKPFTPAKGISQARGDLRAMRKSKWIQRIISQQKKG